MVGGRGIPVRIGQPLGGRKHRAPRGRATGVERLGDENGGARSHARPAACSDEDGCRAVPVVVVHGRPSADEVPPAHHHAVERGSRRVHAGVDAAEEDPSARDAERAPGGRRADRVEAPSRPARVRRRCVKPVDGRVELDGRDRRHRTQGRDLRRARPDGEGVREPEMADRRVEDGRQRALRRAGQASKGAMEGPRPAREGGGIDLPAERHQHRHARLWALQPKLRRERRLERHRGRCRREAGNRGRAGDRDPRRRRADSGREEREREPSPSTDLRRPSSVSFLGHVIAPVLRSTPRAEVRNDRNSCPKPSRTTRRTVHDPLHVPTGPA